jgi:hypothetical protein
MTVSAWRTAKNQQALARLRKTLPTIFPAAVLTHALNRPFTPPTPRLAVDSYWRAHPVRADRLARVLAAQSGAPAGWTWRVSCNRRDNLPASFRSPPAPYREAAFSRGAGFCCVCGQPVYRFGWHIDLWDRGPNRNAGWHTACVVAWSLWNAPSGHVRLLKRLQSRRCAASGQRLWKTAEVDHRVPLFRVWREQRDNSWPRLLAFWGFPNLQVINREVHAAKCASEARYRGRSRPDARTDEFDEIGDAF